eukprot:XP_011435286.1 PREDICTED: uncharacterized protein LOC105333804 [Crassostrea gigas]
MKLLSFTIILNFVNAAPFLQKVQQCFPKGSRTEDGLVRMCTSCVVTTDLGVNYWPRYFTEITCHGPDTACLNFHRDPHEVSPPPIMPSHGKCTESIIHMTFFRYENVTTVGASNTRKGQWNTYTQDIRGGCVCGFDKRSRILHNFFYNSQLHPSS